MAKRKNGEGSFYRRNRIWWYAWTDPELGQRYTSTGKTKKAEAEAYIKEMFEATDAVISRMRGADYFSYEDLEKLMLNKRIMDNALDPVRREKAIKEANKRLKNLRKWFEGSPVDKISYDDIETYKRKRLSGEITSSRKPGSPATINRELSALKTMLNRALKSRKIDSLPHIEMLREPKPEPKALSEEDTERLLKYLEEHEEYRHLLGPVTFACLTGWRKEQILNMKHDWVDTKRGVVTAPAHYTKTDEVHEIPIHRDLEPLLISLINNAPPDCKYVFYCTRNKHISTPEDYRIRDFRGAWSAVCRELGLGYGYKLNRDYVEEMEARGIKPGPTFHALRNTAVVMFLRKGLDAIEGMTFTGHKTRSTFDRYAKFDMKAKRNILEKLYR